MTDLSHIAPQIDSIALELKRVNDHDEARSQALGEAIESGYFENDPYSRYAPLRTFVADCGCEARRGLREWIWNDSKCSFDF